jgi:ATP synthase protein I
LLDAKYLDFMLRVESKAVRVVLGWQVTASIVCGLLAAWLDGFHGAVSAALGGAVGVLAGLGFALVIQLNSDKSAGGTLVTALQAEAVKIGLAVTLLWLVLTTYRDVIASVCVGSFIFSMLIFSMAFFVRDNGNR